MQDAWHTSYPAPSPLQRQSSPSSPSPKHTSSSTSPPANMTGKPITDASETSENALIDHLQSLNLGSSTLQRDEYLTMDVINKTFDGTFQSGNHVCCTFTDGQSHDRPTADIPRRSGRVQQPCEREVYLSLMGVVEIERGYECKCPIV